MAMPRKLSATKRMRMTHHEKRVGFAEPAAVVASLEKSAQLPLKVAAEASKQEAAAAAAQRTKEERLGAELARLRRGERRERGGERAAVAAAGDRHTVDSAPSKTGVSNSVDPDD